MSLNTVQYVEKPSGIQALKAAPAQQLQCYDLQGRVTSTPLRGIFVQNGRKIIR
jgi:hypothetical protein